MKYLFIKALLISSVIYLGELNAAGFSDDPHLSTSSSSKGLSLETAKPSKEVCLVSLPQALLPSTTMAEKHSSELFQWVDDYLPIAHPDGPARKHIRELLGLKTLPSGAREVLRGDRLAELIDLSIWAIHGLLEPLHHQHLEKTGILARVKQTGILSEGDLQAFAVYHQACCEYIDKGSSYHQGWKTFARALKPVPIGPLTAELFSLAKLSPGTSRPSFTCVKGISSLALLLSEGARGGVVMTSSVFNGQPFETRDCREHAYQDRLTATALPAEAIVGKFFQDRVFSATRDQPLLSDLPERAFHNGILMPSQLSEEQKKEFLEKLRTEGSRIQRENCLRIMARWIEGPVLSVSVSPPYFPEPEKLSDTDREISRLFLVFQYKAAAQFAIGRHFVTGEAISFHVFPVGKNTGNPPEAIKAALMEVIDVVHKHPANLFSPEEAKEFNLPEVNVFFHAETKEDDDFIKDSLPEDLKVQEMTAEEFFSRASFSSSKLATTAAAKD
jgi:hypothetical protein